MTTTTGRRVRGTGSVRELEPGRWEISVPWQGRRRYRRVRGTAADAERALAELVKQPVGKASWSLHVPEPTTKLVRAGTVSMWMDQWLSLHDGREGTINRYRNDVERHIKPSIGGIQLVELREMDIKRFYAEIARKELKPTTVKHVADTLTASLNEAVLLHELDKSPAGSVKKPKVPRVEMNIPSRQQVEDVLSLCMERTPMLFPLMRTIVYTGGRRGEVTALRWENVDLVTGRIRFKEQWVIENSKPILRDYTKTGEVRTIPLDPATVAMLEEHRAEQDKLLEAGQMVNKGVVFADGKGDFIHPRRLLNNVSAYSAEVGNPFTIHDLRHFHASVLLQSGVPISTVSKRLGHKDIMTTYRFYSHLLQGDEERAPLVFGEYMGSTEKGAQIVGV